MPRSRAVASRFGPDLYIWRPWRPRGGVLAVDFFSDQGNGVGDPQVDRIATCGHGQCGGERRPTRTVFRADRAAPGRSAADRMDGGRMRQGLISGEWMRYFQYPSYRES